MKTREVRPKKLQTLLLFVAATFTQLAHAADEQQQARAIIARAITDMKRLEKLDDSLFARP